MPWFQVDDQLSFHAKVIAAQNPAMGLWVRAGAWPAGGPSPRLIGAATATGG